MKRLFSVLLPFAFPVYAYEVADNFIYPLNNYVVNCNGYWGVCNKPNERHLGEDVMTNPETLVFADANGVVKEARYSSGYGGVVIIEHTLKDGSNVTSISAHMYADRLKKSAGETVNKGELLGYIADSENNGGWAPHLHFGIHKGSYNSFNHNYECGWSYAGYTQQSENCLHIKDDWHVPSDFIEDYNSSQPETTYATITIHKLGNYGWYPDNVACTEATKWYQFSDPHPQPPFTQMQWNHTETDSSVCYKDYLALYPELKLDQNKIDAILFGTSTANQCTVIVD